MIRILLVDDNPLMRKLLTQLIESEKEYRVLAEAENEEEALRILDQNAFDIVLIDVSLNEQEAGIDLIKTIRQRGMNIPILSVSLHEKSIYAERLRQAGAQGYLMKQDAAENIIPAIRKISSDKGAWF